MKGDTKSIGNMFHFAFFLLLPKQIITNKFFFRFRINFENVGFYLQSMGMVIFCLGFVQSQGCWSNWLSFQFLRNGEGDMFWAFWDYRSIDFGISIFSPWGNEIPSTNNPLGIALPFYPENNSVSTIQIRLKCLGLRTF